MNEVGTCDIFTTAEEERPIPVYYTYKCGYCSEPAAATMEHLMAHLIVAHNISAGVV